MTMLDLETIGNHLRHTRLIDLEASGDGLRVVCETMVGQRRLKRHAVHGTMRSTSVAQSLKVIDIMKNALSIVSAALALAAASLAFAHAMPTHREPAAGATVEATPSNVVIDFDDSLEPAFSSIDVTDAKGKSVISGKSAVDTANPKRMSVSVGTLSPGKYTVAWVAVAADGHRTHGRYTFSVK